SGPSSCPWAAARMDCASSSGKESSALPSGRKGTPRLRDTVPLTSSCSRRGSTNEGRAIGNDLTLPGDAPEPRLEFRQADKDVLAAHHVGAVVRVAQLHLL